MSEAQAMPASPFELVVNQAGVGVQKIDLPGGGTLTVLQLYTPFMTINVKFDSESAERVADDLRGSGIIRARAIPPVVS